MAHVSLYRKYRSQTFGDLQGQEHVVRTLQNALASGRLAHAYLFTGPRGTGKTSTARLLAKALNCEKGPTPEPCNECSQCTGVTLGSNPDVYEMDAASEAGVEEVREKIIEVADYLPMAAKYKVFIIDEVHDLSGKAFDALLKTIEEPPDHVVFVLATTELHKVPPTIRSRCQNYEFHRASLKELVAVIERVASNEGVQMEAPAVDAIARMADGAYRDALTLLEQAMLTAEETITLDHVYNQLGLIPEHLADSVLLAIKENDPAKIMQLSADLARRGREPKAVLESLEYRLADLTRAAYGVEVGASMDSTREAALHEMGTRLGKGTLIALRSSLAEAHRAIRDVSLPRIWLEAEMLRIASELSEAQPAGAAETAKVQAEGKTARQQPSKNGPATAVVSAAPEADGPLGEARRFWSMVIEQLPQKTAMYMKLHDSVVSEAKGLSLTIEVPREMDCEWMREKPQRFNHVQKLLRDISGKAYTVTYAHGGGAPKSMDEEAVELPLEGQRLEKAAKDILGAT